MQNLTLSTKPTMQQEIAFAILRKTTFLVSAHNIRQAAQVMSKTLAPEAEAMITSLHCCEYDHCGPQVLEFLEKLGAEILTA